MAEGANRSLGTDDDPTTQYGRPYADARRRIAAIVVYFRTPDSLNSCLDGLRAQTAPPDEIVVVDNSSAMDGIDERPGRGDDYHWLRADRNLGYGAACNIGARMTRGAHLLFLNADVILERDACNRMLGVPDEGASVGVVGPRIRGADGLIELSARTFPGAATGVLGRSSRVTKLLAAVARTPSGVSAALGSTGPVDWVSGACMLVRRSAFEDVGGFDENYWMYWEDADLCRRLRNRGWCTWLCVEAEASHDTGSSGTNARTIAAFHDSAARYYELHVARTHTAARLARSLLRARMRLMLLRHGR